MICPLMSRALLQEHTYAKGGELLNYVQEATVKCTRDCALWIKLINPLTGTAREGCAEALKAEALNEIAIELKRKNN